MAWQFRPSHRHAAQDSADRDVLREAGFSDEQIAVMLPVAQAEPEPEFELLACNRKVWDLWLAMATQWRVGMGGAYGLDYGPLHGLWPLYGIKPKHRRAAHDALRAMEREAQKWINQSKPKPAGT